MASSSSSPSNIETKPSKIIEIDSLQQYENELTQSHPSQLVVVNFFSEWPTLMIDPQYTELSQRYQDVKFLTVNVDNFNEIDIKVPTFVLFKGTRKIQEIQEPDPAKIESAIKSCIGINLKSNTNSSRKDILTTCNFPCLIDLMSNDVDTFLSASGILLRFANNILKDPDNLKYRSIKLGNNIFITKLSPVHGAVDCLFSMGFQEVDDKLFLEPDCALSDLLDIRDALMDEVGKRTSFNDETCNKLDNSKIEPAIEGPSNVEVSPESELCANRDVESIDKGEPRQNLSVPVTTFSQQQVTVPRNALCYVPELETQGMQTFYGRMVSSINLIFLYEDDELQKLARDVIPVERLEEQAKRQHESHVENKGTSLGERDCLLILLLAWFKNDFFSWTNTHCKKCGVDTKFHSNDIPNAEEKLWDCGNVECYQCFNCYNITRIPRYNHPQKLLETCTGRCGEWANCFTLCCRAVGFEARYVFDWTDHVWTEVYSEYQNRWLHCDPCENVCDKPLLYEKGWNKELSYIMAFSKDEIIDVTWRYSSLHKDIINRRVLVPEKWLFNFYMKATKELQSDIINNERKSILISRHIVEMVEFLTPRDQSKDEEQGRISGSLNWRTARGEAGGSKSGSDKKSHVFQPTEEHIIKKRMRIQYFPARDYYDTSLEGIHNSTIIQGWQNGVESSENIFRKVENDWKMVYLARCEGTDNGTIKWSIDIRNTNLVISNVIIQIHSQLYENGEIDFKLFNELTSIDLKDGTNVSTDNFYGSKLLNLSACLKGSSGNVAWQHAQLFRCGLSEEKYVGLQFDILFSD